MTALGVTRTGIVPGTYGAVNVVFPKNDILRVFVGEMRSRDDLTAAIDTLTAIRDAMQNGGAA